MLALIAIVTLGRCHDET